MIEITRGDSDIIECTVDQDISAWKIRAELYDRDDNNVRKGNNNVAGGSDTQILVNTAEPNKFTVFITAGDTNILNKRSNFEIELESPEGDILTRLQDTVNILDQRITWNSITD